MRGKVPDYWQSSRRRSSFRATARLSGFGPQREVRGKKKSSFRVRAQREITCGRCELGRTRGNEVRRKGTTSSDFAVLQSAGLQQHEATSDLMLHGCAPSQRKGRGSAGHPGASAQKRMGERTGTANWKRSLKPKPEPKQIASFERWRGGGRDRRAARACVGHLQKGFGPFWKKEADRRAWTQPKLSSG